MVRWFYQMSETVRGGFPPGCKVALAGKGVFYHVDTRPENVLVQFQEYAGRKIEGAAWSSMRPTEVAECLETTSTRLANGEDTSQTTVLEASGIMESANANVKSMRIGKEDSEKMCRALVHYFEHGSFRLRDTTALDRPACGRKRTRWNDETVEWTPTTKMALHVDFRESLDAEFREEYTKTYGTDDWRVDDVDNHQYWYRRPVSWFHYFQSFVFVNGFNFRPPCYCGMPLEELWCCDPISALCECKGCGHWLHAACLPRQSLQANWCEHDYYCDKCLPDRRRAIAALKADVQFGLDDKDWDDVQKMEQLESDAAVLLLSPFRCPITNATMRAPYRASDGHNYDRDALINHLENNSVIPLTPQASSPLTNKELENVFTANRAMLRFLRAFVRNYRSCGDIGQAFDAVRFVPAAASAGADYRMAELADLKRQREAASSARPRPSTPRAGS